MRLLRIPEAFNHREFLWEPKMDGFRAVAHVQRHHCTLISRNGHVFKFWPQLAAEVARSVRCNSAILDGEIVCLDSNGKPDFKALLFRRAAPFFYAFDVLEIDGDNLCEVPLWQRQRRLRRVMPRRASRLLPVEQIPVRGIDFFRAACDHDLEGVVAKWAGGRYVPRVWRGRPDTTPGIVEIGIGGEPCYRGEGHPAPGAAHTVNECRQPSTPPVRTERVGCARLCPGRG